jgi:hypothetical protein
MSRCAPGTPCYRGDDPIVYKTYPRGCTTSQQSPYTLPLPSEDIYYDGPNLPYTGIQTETDLTTALQQIDVLLNPEEIIAAIITALENNPTLKSQFCTLIGTCP